MITHKCPTLWLTFSHCRKSTCKGEHLASEVVKRILYTYGERYLLFQLLVLCWEVIISRGIKNVAPVTSRLKLGYGTGPYHRTECRYRSVGLWLDARFGYNGVVSIVGLIIGVVSGFLVAYRLLQRVLAGGGFGDG